MTYTEYMAEVDRIIAGKLEGLTSQDLPDYNTRDCYDNEVTPQECADGILHNAFDGMNDSIFSPNSDKTSPEDMARLEASIVGHPTFFCPATNLCLDLDKSILIAFDWNGSSIRYWGPFRIEALKGCSPIQFVMSRSNVTLEWLKSTGITIRQIGG